MAPAALGSRLITLNLERKASSSWPILVRKLPGKHSDWSPILNQLPRPRLEYQGAPAGTGVQPVRREGLRLVSPPVPGWGGSGAGTVRRAGASAGSRAATHHAAGDRPQAAVLQASIPCRLTSAAATHTACGTGGQTRVLQTPERSALLGQQSPQGVADTTPEGPAPWGPLASLGPRPRPPMSPMGACTPALPRGPSLDPKAEAAPSSPSREPLRFQLQAASRPLGKTPPGDSGSFARLPSQ